ncbi:MAG TPA: hypothetical protein VHT73_08825 [Thermodesulfobacteriota bacterium]|nr:hypothetical protein [Thermodesulfobacteriota bacterium]
MQTAPTFARKNMITIRRERPEDVPQIHYVNEKAFGRPAEANLVDALRMKRYQSEFDNV